MGNENIRRFRRILQEQCLFDRMAGAFELLSKEFNEKYESHYVLKKQDYGFKASFDVRMKTQKQTIQFGKMTESGFFTFGQNVYDYSKSLDENIQGIIRYAVKFFRNNPLYHESR